jgi:hypothetical protein
MQYTEVVSQSTSSPQGSPTIRYSENRNSSSASTSDKTSIQQQNFIWEPFLGSVVTAKSTEGCSSIVSYPVSMRREFVNIRMQRSFIFDEEKCTWKWFKTWRLPEIRLVVNEQESFLPSFVRLSVVCPGQDLRWFEEVSLLGTTQVQLVNGEAKFTRLRFGATSSSYEGRNFHLLIAFFSETAYCLGALISTGFVVYARGPNTASFQEGVRFTQAMKSKSLWFSPEQLTRPFMKKVGLQLTFKLILKGSSRCEMNKVLLERRQLRIMSQAWFAIFKRLIFALSVVILFFLLCVSLVSWFFF